MAVLPLFPKILARPGAFVTFATEAADEAPGTFLAAAAGLPPISGGPVR